MKELSSYGQVKLPTINVSAPRIHAKIIAERHVKLNKYSTYYCDYGEFGDKKRPLHLAAAGLYGTALHGINFKKKGIYSTNQNDFVHSKEERDQIEKIVDQEIMRLEQSIKFRIDKLIPNFVKLAQKSADSSKKELEQWIEESTKLALNNARSLPAFMQEKVLLEIYESAKTQKRWFSIHISVSWYEDYSYYVYDDSLIKTVSQCEFLKVFDRAICESILEQLNAYSLPYFLKTLKEFNEKAFYALLKILDRENSTKNFHGHFGQHVRDISREQAEIMMHTLQAKIKHMPANTGLSISLNDDSFFEVAAGLAIGASLFD